MFIQKKNTCEVTTSEKSKSYMNTWIMMQVDAANDSRFFARKSRLQSLSRYAKEFQLDLYPTLSPDKQTLLRKEWEDFARLYIQTCLNSKNYRSTLFGAVPMKDATVAQKLANDILLLTQDYPSKYNQEELFRPLYEAFYAVYCQEVDSNSTFFYKC